jgi:hypothetical protein
LFDVGDGNISIELEYKKILKNGLGRKFRKSLSAIAWGTMLQNRRILKVELG